MTLLFKCSLNVNVDKHFKKREDKFIYKFYEAIVSQKAMLLVALRTCIPNMGALSTWLQGVQAWYPPTMCILECYYHGIFDV